MGVFPKAKTFVTKLPDGRLQQQSHYVFARVGDEIPLHEHGFYHSTCVLRGCIEVYNSAGKRVIVRAGEFVGFNAGIEHAIVAIEDGTEVINVKEPSIGAVDQV